MSLQSIISEVAETFEVRPIDIIGISRKRRVCMARWCVMARLADKGWTGHRISKALNRHHTTIYHAMGRLNK